jgi:hypothetical protein
MIEKNKTTARQAYLLIASILVSSVICLLFLEVGYRAYLALRVPNVIPDAYQINDTPSFSVYAPPGRWQYNREVGFDFVSEGHITADIEDGVFARCSAADGINDRKNISFQESRFDTASIRGALIGSSFTMGSDANGDLFHEVLTDKLAAKIDQDVWIENYSRDSYGFIQMMDMAAQVAEIERPDFLIIAFNTATVSMARHWRTVVPFENGYHNFYFLFSPNLDDINNQKALLHRFVVYDEVTKSWCEEMTRALRNNDYQRLKEDPIIIAATERHKEILRSEPIPTPTVDLLELTASYLFNRIFYQNAFWGMDVYADQESRKRPLSILKYADDSGFRDSVKKLRASQVPVVIIHIPSFPEIKSGDEWAATGYAGIPKSQELSLIRSVESGTGYKIESLLPLINAPRSDAAALAKEAEGENIDWHPNKRGVELFAEAIADLTIEEFNLPKKF